MRKFMECFVEDIRHFMRYHQQQTLTTSAFSSEIDIDEALCYRSFDARHTMSFRIGSDRTYS